MSVANNSKPTFFVQVATQESFSMQQLSAPSVAKKSVKKMDKGEIIVPPASNIKSTILKFEQKKNDAPVVAAAVQDKETRRKISANNNLSSSNNTTIVPASTTDLQKKMEAEEAKLMEQLNNKMNKLEQERLAEMEQQFKKRMQELDAMYDTKRKKVEQQMIELDEQVAKRQHMSTLEEVCKICYYLSNRRLECTESKKRSKN